MRDSFKVLCLLKQKLIIHVGGWQFIMYVYTSHQPSIIANLCASIFNLPILDTRTTTVNYTNSKTNKMS